MEIAIAKSVAAFLNSRGGTLVIGADDTGTAIGLDRDLATMRTPDHDRFELWLRDMLSKAIGRDAAAQP
ncbi:ATP-binding protein, partial [Acinetobacter baumannii]